MTEGRLLTAQAAIWIWVAAVIGAWVIAVSTLGALYGDVMFCGDPEWQPPGVDGAVLHGWVVLGSGAVVPVLVMVAAAPAGRRRWLIVLAVVVAVFELWVFDVWIGDCLACASNTIAEACKMMLTAASSVRI